MHGSLQQQPSLSSLRYSRILALDLGKFNSVLCNYDPAVAGHAFVSLATDRQTIRDRLAETAGSSDRSSILVVFETCEISGWVFDVVSEMGFKVAVANPSNEAWLWRMRKQNC